MPTPKIPKSRPTGPGGWALVSLVLLGCGRSEADKSRPMKPVTSSVSSPATATQAWFTEAATPTLTNLTHTAGTNWFMGDQVGSGCVLQDFDNDGRLDLYLVQNGGPGSGARNALYQQLENGDVRRVAPGSGADLEGHGMGAIAGDFNNDGLADLVVTEYGAVHLLWNRGGLKFQDISHAAGIDNPRWAVPASLVDFDRDGWLDLVVGNYLDYDPTQVCYDVQGRRDFCSPEAFPPTPLRLWRNITAKAGAAPQFEDWTERSGLTRSPGAALGLVCVDFTGDGWPDIFCADDGRPNRLFVNQHNGTFKEEASMRGLAFNSMGRTAANMGVAWADFDGDAMGDLFVTHLTEEFHSLYRQDRPGLFTDVVAQAGLQQQAWRGTGFGIVAADFDNDCQVDLALANGLVSHAMPAHTPVRLGTAPWWAAYAQRAQLFVNIGNGKFRDVSIENPAFCGQASVGRSLAVGDWNRDGGLDLVMGNVAGPAVVWLNTLPGRGNWVQFRLVDPAHGLRDEIGAEANVRVGERRQWAVLQPATSYLSSHEPVLHFGLGRNKNFDAVDVQWPDGSKESFPGGPGGQRRVLRHGSGQVINREPR